MRAVVFFLPLLLFAACNNHKDSRASDESTVVDTNAVIRVDSSYDPDPTDTIPAGSYGINTSSKETAEKVRRFLHETFKSDLDKNVLDSASRKFCFFEFDLNEDGAREVFVGLSGPYFCGTGGCTLFLLNNAGQLINKFTVAGMPVIIGKNKTKGWTDLIIYSNRKDRVVQFDGKQYPSNPSLQPVLEVKPSDELVRALNVLHEPYAWFSF